MSDIEQVPPMRREAFLYVKRQKTEHEAALAAERERREVAKLKAERCGACRAREP